MAPSPQFIPRPATAATSNQVTLLHQRTEMLFERVAVAARQANRLAHRDASVLACEFDDLQRQRGDPFLQLAAVLVDQADLALERGNAAVDFVEAGLAAGLKPTTLAGAGLGAVAGSAMGAMTGFWTRRAQTEHELESLRRGGALVAIHADESRVDEVERILYQQGAYAIEDRVVRRRNAAWPAGNPLAARLADEKSDSRHRRTDPVLRRP